MGVDYDGNYGIGVEIKPIKKVYLYDYLEELPKPKGFDTHFFEIGNCMFGDNITFYLCIENPFENGIEGFNEKYKLFETYLKENKIKYKNSIDVVGGLIIS